ncbi:hypothetical protein L3Q82_009184, partial [Scortum barcoo]
PVSMMFLKPYSESSVLSGSPPPAPVIRADICQRALTFGDARIYQIQSPCGVPLGRAPVRFQALPVASWLVSPFQKHTWLPRLNAPPAPVIRADICQRALTFGDARIYQIQSPCGVPLGRPSALVTLDNLGPVQQNCDPIAGPRGGDVSFECLTRVSSVLVARQAARISGGVSSAPSAPFHWRGCRTCSLPPAGFSGGSPRRLLAGVSLSETHMAPQAERSSAGPFSHQASCASRPAL